jgi:hypothetical protein
VGARLEWGSWPVPYAATVAWGARAIYRLDVHDTQYRRGKVIRRAGTTAVIDLLYDRQGAAARDGAPERDRKALATWLNKTAMPALRRECVKRYVTSDCEAMIEIESDGFKLVAGPRGSCGYLYIRAWKVG